MLLILVPTNRPLVKRLLRPLNRAQVLIMQTISFVSADFARTSSRVTKRRANLRCDVRRTMIKVESGQQDYL
jgi:hypothetical protein